MFSPDREPNVKYLGCAVALFPNDLAVATQRYRNPVVRLVSH